MPLAPRFGLVAVVLNLCLVGCNGTDFSRPLGDTDDAHARAYWEEIAPRCGGYPSKESCDDGDMTLFGGLLCAAGDERGCALVRESQGADGRWWRSPRRTPGNLGLGNSFSRDMSLGVMLYLATTHDAPAARRWLSWIETHRPCLTPQPLGDGCLVRGPHRFCTDDSDQRCTMTPANWGVLGRVFEALDLPRNAEMRLYAGVDDEALWLKAREAPAGYESHLAGVEVLLKERLDATPGTRERAAGMLAERQPDNPFFKFLHEDRDTELPTRLERLCPKRGDDARRRQWAWERDTASRAWEESMGWDCLFLDRLTANQALSVR